MHQPAIPRPRLSRLLPVQAQVLLAEIAMVEEEISSLERKVDELSLCMHQEKKQIQEWKLNQKHRYRKCNQGRQNNGLVDFKSQKKPRDRRASLGSPSDTKSLSSSRSSLCNEINNEKPNRISEELIKCLIRIFLRMNRPFPEELDCQESAILPKRVVSCMSTKGLVSKTSFSCKPPAFPLDDRRSMLDPYGVLPDFDRTSRDVGPYKTFIQITRTSFSMNHVSECYQEITNLRVLVHKLSNVDLSFLTDKQKLAFWINIYNACIMHAFLQHGLPSTEADKFLSLMNKAALNVGGMVLNALAIEHFILRHPTESHHNGDTNENEVRLRRTYGLRYPEPEVTFALCRGSWSSPALRIYTEDVVNELGRAKTEYLQASIGVTSRKRIVVPKLLHWYMQDFADDMESLLEWIYSQLPQSGPLKRLIMECLNGETKNQNITLVKIHPYKSEFRYLLTL
ncbi:hypothetical protein MKX03_034871 [Papaver bracteatum]|nr:hypothetical protein MKX03_034871 [Papaver bracteatum]